MKLLGSLIADNSSVVVSQKTKVSSVVYKHSSNYQSIVGFSS